MRNTIRSPRQLLHRYLREEDILLRIWTPGIDAWYASLHGARALQRASYPTTDVPEHIRRFLRMPLPTETCFIALIMGGLTLNSKRIHRSHQLAWRRGILFCTQCGSYTHKRVGNLSKQCLLRVPSNTTRRILNGMIEGTRSPLLGGIWPAEDDVPPIHILSRAGSSLRLLRD